MSLQSSSSDVWTVHYKAQTDAQVFSEVTTNPDATVARLEAAGYIIIDVIQEV